MGVPATMERLALGMLLLACGLGACIRAPALVVGARSTFATGDRTPLRVVLLCGLDWSRATGSAGGAASGDSLGAQSDVQLEFEESGTVESDCMIASVCEWEARARQATLSRTLAALPEAAP
jgi:hypothetical protein